MNDGKTVVVCCKIPSGLHLDLVDKSGDKKRVTLKGSNSARIIGGYGMTENVPEEFMTEWFRLNARHPAVTSGHIFIHEKRDSAAAKAKEQREIKTGLEAIDPVKNGMLRNQNGENDPAALKAYKLQKESNPDRNRQIVE